MTLLAAPAGPDAASATGPASAPAPAPADATPSLRRNVGIVAVVTIAIGVASYGTSLAAVRVLPATQFSAFAAAQGLLLVLGTGSVAALPWAVARFLATSPRATGRDVTDRDAAGQAMRFGLVGAALQAVALAPVAFAVCWYLDGPLFAGAGALAAAFISLLAGPIGYLQGRDLMPAIAVVRGLETGARVVTTALFLLLVARSATLAVLAFPLGSAVALAYALHRGRDGFPLRRAPRATVLRLTRDAALLGGIQVLLAMLGALDTVYVDAGRFSATGTASYQAAALLARIPLFFSGAIAISAYTRLAAAPDEREAGVQIRAALRTFGWLAVPFVAGYLTMPSAIVHLVVPARYTDTLPVLRVLCLAGVLIGVINVLTTAHQARGRFRSCLRILGAGVVLQAAVLLGVGRTGHLLAFTAAGAVVCALMLALLVRDARDWLRARGTRPALRPQALAGAAAIVAAAFVHQPVLWSGLLLVVTLCAFWLAFTTRTDAAPGDPGRSCDTPVNPTEEHSR